MIRLPLIMAVLHWDRHAFAYSPAPRILDDVSNRNTPHRHSIVCLTDGSSLEFTASHRPCLQNGCCAEHLVNIRSFVAAVALGLVFAFVGPVGRSNAAEGWSHADTSAWANNYPQCSAASQSPINIVTADVDTSSSIAEARENLASHVAYQALQKSEIFHNGHVMQVNGEFGTLSLPDGEYDVKQFHFHFPGEHEIDGKRGDGELHIVHEKRGAGGTKDVAVVAIKLEEDSQASGSELNFLANLGFGNALPADGAVYSIQQPVDLDAFQQELAGDFFHYRGSLTTPPCSQNVHWYVAKIPIRLTRKMILSFQERFPPHGDNRPVQPVNGRQIVLNRMAVDGEFAALLRT